MKKRLLIILITIALVVFMMPTVSADSGTPPTTAGGTGTEVKAKAEPIYVFTAPSSATITYPQTQAGLGNFVVGDLFLESGEWLTVNVLPESMVNMGNHAVTLPYQLSFHPPTTLNADNIGETYATTVVIAPNVLENAHAGTYHAILRFQVTSHPEGVVVWEGITTVIVKVNNRKQSTPSSEPTYSSEASQVTTSSSLAVPSRVSTPSKASPASVVTIEPEPTPGETPEMGAIVMRYGLAFAALVLSALIILTRLIGKRKNPVERPR